jgi:hypothetical protein
MPAGRAGARGVPGADGAVACLRELCQAGSPDGLVLTEVNPTHDPSGELIGRYIDGVTAALAAAR